MKICLILAVAATCCFHSAQTRAALVARYDWRDGATDVSGSPIQHDGVLEPGVSVQDDKLVVAGWEGVVLGYMPELDGATDVRLRFEDVTITELPTGTGLYAVLAGGGYDQWWVGIDYDLPLFGNRTMLTFNVGGWGSWGVPFHEYEVAVADEVITHFESIEYRYDGAALPSERLGIRWNDGPWITGGWSNPEEFATFPSTGTIRLNDGGRADWDPVNATLGAVSMSAAIPEPSGPILLGMSTLALLASGRRRRNCTN